MKITFKSLGIIKILSTIAILLIIANIVMLFIYFLVHNPNKFDFVQMVDLDQESNLPTFFSSTILLIAGFLFYLLSKSSIKEKKYWLGLSLIFVFLAFDESAQIHETLGDYTEKFVESNGYLYYPWVISYTILVMVLGIVYMHFFWRMKSNIFWSFMGSAFMYLSGAIGFELLGAKEASLHGSDTLIYCTYYTIEESLEMFGVIYLIWILLNLLSKKSISLSIDEN